MKNKIRYDDPDPEGENSWDDPEFEMLLTPNDKALFEVISDYMTGSRDIEEVMSDRGYKAADEIAVEMVRGNDKRNRKRSEKEKFIRDSLNERFSEIRISDEIADIEQEPDTKEIERLSEDWVDSWLKRKDGDNIRDPKTKERTDFITASLDDDNELVPKTKKRTKVRSLVIRYTSLAAAVVIVAVLLIRPALFSDDPVQIFTKYYEPFPAASTVTRGNAENVPAIFSDAVIKYRQGDYIDAEEGFLNAMSDGTLVSSATFFLGLTEIGLNHFRKAAGYLENATKNEGEYLKDARWYLGLAYLRTGQTEKAYECFQYLAGTPGFYKKRSEGVLRRLK